MITCRFSLNLQRVQAGSTKSPFISNALPATCELKSSTEFQNLRTKRAVAGPLPLCCTVDNEFARSVSVFVSILSPHCRLYNSVLVTYIHANSAGSEEQRSFFRWGVMTTSLMPSEPQDNLDWTISRECCPSSCRSGPASARACGAGALPCCQRAPEGGLPAWAQSGL